MSAPDTTAEKLLKAAAFFLSDTAGRTLTMLLAAVSGGVAIFLTKVPAWVATPLFALQALILLLLLLSFPVLVKRARRFGDRLAGKWRWQGHLKTVFFPDGRVVSETDTARWECVDDMDRRILVTWTKGYVDTLAVSEDFVRLDGTNQNGESVRAEKMA